MEDIKLNNSSRNWVRASLSPRHNLRYQQENFLLNKEILLVHLNNLILVRMFQSWLMLCLARTATFSRILF
jgi:hypothetical protein